MWESEEPSLELQRHHQSHSIKNVVGNIRSQKYDI